MASTKNTTTTTEIPDVAKKLREQLVSTVQRSQELSVEAAQTWVKAVSVLPVPELPKLPGAPVVPDVEAATTYGYDLASELLSAQRDYVVQLTSVLTPEKSA